MQGVSRGREVHGRADRRNCAELGWPFLSPFSCELEHEIAAHGESSESEPGNPVLELQIFSNGSNILGAPRVIQSRRQRVRAAAIALVHAHHVHARGHTLRRNAQHVLGFTRTLEAVHNNHRQRVFPVCLPMAVAQYLNARFNFDQALFGWGDAEAPWEKETSQRLAMSAAQSASWHKLLRYRLRSSHTLILNGSGL